MPSVTFLFSHPENQQYYQYCYHNHCSYRNSNIDGKHRVVFLSCGLADAIVAAKVWIFVISIKKKKSLTISTKQF
jgi:hypothetical protein